VTLLDEMFPRRHRPGYVKEERTSLPPDRLRAVRCRGDIRATTRRADRYRLRCERKGVSGWRTAHADSRPFRRRIVERIEREWAVARLVFRKMLRQGAA